MSSNKPATKEQRDLIKKLADEAGVHVPILPNGATFLYCQDVINNLIRRVQAKL